MIKDTHRLIVDVLQEAIGDRLLSKDQQAMVLDLLNGNIYDFSPIYEDFDIACGPKSIHASSEVTAKYLGASTKHFLEDSSLVLTNDNSRFFDLPYNNLWVRIDNPIVTSQTLLGFYRVDEQSTIVLSYIDMGGKSKVFPSVLEYTSNNKVTIIVPQMDEVSQTMSVLGIFATLFPFVFRTFERLSEYNEKKKAQLNIYAEVAGKDEKPRYVKVGNKNTSKRFNSPLNPIYVVLDSEKGLEEAKKYKRNQNRSFEYTFSWIVKGHYRTLHNPKTVGVSRCGNRDIVGKTWIASYTKGNRDCPIRVKPETIVLQSQI